MEKILLYIYIYIYIYLYVYIYISKTSCALKIMTITRTLTIRFDKIRSLFKWKLELMRVMHCLNRSWIRDSYHRDLAGWVGYWSWVIGRGVIGLEPYSMGVYCIVLNNKRVSLLRSWEPCTRSVTQDLFLE